MLHFSGTKNVIAPIIKRNCYYLDENAFMLNLQTQFGVAAVHLLHELSLFIRFLFPKKK